MNETPKMPIWMLILICVITAIIVVAVLLQILLEVSIPGLIPFLTAGLIGIMLISYFRSPKKDKTLLTIFIVALVLNLLGGILQIVVGAL